MFNTLFTSLPVIFMGIFEKDLSASTLLAVPELYTKGQRNGGFNFKVYLGWMFMASGGAMVVYFCMLSLYGEALFTEDNSIFALGSITYTACVILISAKMQYVPICLSFNLHQESNQPQIHRNPQQDDHKLNRHLPLRGRLVSLEYHLVANLQPLQQDLLCPRHLFRILGQVIYLVALPHPHRALCDDLRVRHRGTTRYLLHNRRRRLHGVGERPPRETTLRRSRR